jgi:cytidylate kinase
VLPDPDLKLYLRASAEERAQRRAAERGVDADDHEAAAILDSLRRRDQIDAGRAVAPLRVAADAVVVVSDGLAFEETVRRVVAIARAAMAHPGNDGVAAIQGRHGAGAQGGDGASASADEARAG